MALVSATASTSSTHLAVCGALLILERLLVDIQFTTNVQSLPGCYETQMAGNMPSYRQFAVTITIVALGITLSAHLSNYLDRNS
jgi:hypothetical protein